MLLVERWENIHTLSSARTLYTHSIYMYVPVIMFDLLFVHGYRNSRNVRGENTQGSKVLNSGLSWGRSSHPALCALRPREVSPIRAGVRLMTAAWRRAISFRGCGTVCVAARPVLPPSENGTVRKSPVSLVREGPSPYLLNRPSFAMTQMPQKVQDEVRNARTGIRRLEVINERIPATGETMVRRQNDNLPNETRTSYEPP
jgi:hypothetical protein